MNSETQHSCRKHLWLWIFIGIFAAIFVASLLLLLFWFSRDCKYDVASTVSYMVAAMSFIATATLGAISVWQAKSAAETSKNALRVARSELELRSFCFLKVNDDLCFTMTDAERAKIYLMKSYPITDAEKQEYIEPIPNEVRDDISDREIKTGVEQDRYNEWQGKKHFEYNRIEYNRIEYNRIERVGNERILTLYFKNIGDGIIKDIEISKANLYYYEESPENGYQPQFLSLKKIIQLNRSFVIKDEVVKARLLLEWNQALVTEKPSQFSEATRDSNLKLEIDFCITPEVGKRFNESCELFGVVSSIPSGTTTDVVVFSWLTAMCAYQKRELSIAGT